MEYPAMVSFRMTVDDYARLTASADAVGMERSEYLRTLVRMPAGPAGGGGTVYVIDNSTLAKMHSELVRWGRHYNQAVRALNTIALFIRRGSPPGYGDFAEMISGADEKLGEVEQGRKVVEYVLAEIALSAKVAGS
jgi:hypothetical protein